MSDLLRCLLLTRPLCALVVVALPLGLPAARAEVRGNCLGTYAEDLSAMSRHARDLDTTAASYAFAVRTTAVYECVSYGGDGRIKRVTSTMRAHGTGFGYRYDGGDTLLITNEHVADWPDVTDEDHPVEGVNAGCKRLSDSLAIVDDDRDDYAADDIPLTRVVVDPALDVAILRAHAKLAILPWRLGKSASLVSRDAVEVKGFPLGKFRATNTGKVVSPYHHDDQDARNHDDFIIDALLASGGSGSPVLAVSCATGELELVGIFHSRYASASALNVVIAIDQVRELMATLRRSPAPREPVAEIDQVARAQLTEAIVHDPNPWFFSLAHLTAKVHARADGSLVFAVFPAEFPRQTRPLLVLEDLKDDDPTHFGVLGNVYLAAPTGLVLYSPADADADVHAQLARTLELFRRDALAALDHRAAVQTTAKSREAFERATKKRLAFTHMLESQRRAMQVIIDLVARVALAMPASAGHELGLIEIEALVPPVPPVPPPPAPPPLPPP